MALALGFVANAQYSVGDVYEKDGVKAVVVYANEDGDHGLILKLDKELSKEELKDAKAAWKSMNKKDYKAQAKTKFEVMEKHMLAVCDRLTEEGSSNFQVIEQYCSDNQIDMDEAFPDFATVKTLGPDWFIPGDRELEYVYAFICNGFGKENSFDAKDIKKGPIEKIRSNAGYEDFLLPGFNKNGQPIQGYKSSTWSQAPESEKEKLNGIAPHCTVVHMQARPMGAMKYWVVFQNEHLSQRGTGLATMFIKETTPLYQLWTRAATVAVSEF